MRSHISPHEMASKEDLEFIRDKFGYSSVSEAANGFYGSDWWELIDTPEVQAHVERRVRLQHLTAAGEHEEAQALYGTPLKSDG